jgi:hypothetical protein
MPRLGPGGDSRSVRSRKFSEWFQSGLKTDGSTPSFTVLEWIAGSFQSGFQSRHASTHICRVATAHTCPRLRHRSRASPLRTNTTRAHTQSQSVSRSVTSQHTSQTPPHTPARAAPHTAQCTAAQRRTCARARARSRPTHGAASWSPPTLPPPAGARSPRAACRRTRPGRPPPW